jgi:flagellar hook protein FlgE
MLDSIYIGMSGLNSYAEGLRVISNNAANLNTPGFKSASLQFGDMFYTTSGTDGSLNGQTGFGVQTFGTSLNFKQGDMQQTGNSLDLGVDGQGLFTVRDDQGNLHYTRDGQFTFNADGLLVDKTDKAQVVGVDTNGAQSTFTLNGFRSNAAKATTKVSFNGNISSTQTTVSVGTVTVLDATGGSHTLSLTLTNNQATKAGEWTVSIKDGTTEVGTGTLEFPNGQIDASTSTITLSYQPANHAAQSIALDFSSDVTSFASGTSSTLAQTTQDGIAAGTLTGVSFDAAGTIVYAYSNGQTTNGNHLQLARFDTINAVKSDGANEFDMTNAALWHTGIAGDQGFGAIKSGVVEVSNVDLSQEFSELVIMQRGYQASSQVVSTANEMLQQLFSMSGGK